MNFFNPTINLKCNFIFSDCPDDSIPQICMYECAQADCHPTLDTIKMTISDDQRQNSDWWSNRHTVNILCEADPCKACHVSFTLNGNPVECSGNVLDFYYASG